MDNTSIKANIRAARKRLGLTQIQMAQKLGIDRSTYIALESGEREFISKYLDEIAKVLGINTERLCSPIATRENLEDGQVLYGDDFKKENELLKRSLEGTRKRIAELEDMVEVYKRMAEDKQFIIDLLKEKSSH